MPSFFFAGAGGCYFLVPGAVYWTRELWFLRTRTAFGRTATTASGAPAATGSYGHCSDTPAPGATAVPGGTAEALGTPDQTSRPLRRANNLMSDFSMGSA